MILFLANDCYIWNIVNGNFTTFKINFSAKKKEIKRREKKERKEENGRIVRRKLIQGLNFLS